MGNHKSKLSDILRATSERAEEVKKKLIEEKLKSEELNRKKIAAIEKRRDNEAIKIQSKLYDLFDMLWENEHQIIYILEIDSEYKYLESIGFSLEKPTVSDGENIEKTSELLINKIKNIEAIINNGALKYRIDFDADRVIMMDSHAIEEELTSLKRNLQNRINRIEATAKQHQLEYKKRAAETMDDANQKIEKYKKITSKYGSRDEITKLLDMDAFNKKYLESFNAINFSSASANEKNILKRRAALRTAWKVNPALQKMNDDDVIELIRLLNDERIDSNNKEQLKHAERLMQSIPDIDSIAIKLGLNEELTASDEAIKPVESSLSTVKELNFQLSQFNLCEFRPGESRVYENILKFPQKNFYSKKISTLGDRINYINLILNDILTVLEIGVYKSKSMINRKLVHYANLGAKSVKVNISDNGIYFNGQRKDFLEIPISSILLIHIFEREGLQVSKKTDDVLNVSW